MTFYPARRDVLRIIDERDFDGIRNLRTDIELLLPSSVAASFLGARGSACW